MLVLSKPLAKDSNINPYVSGLKSNLRKHGNTRIGFVIRVPSAFFF